MESHDQSVSKKQRQITPHLLSTMQHHDLARLAIRFLYELTNYY